MFRRSKNFLLGLAGLFGTMLQRKVETIPQPAAVVPVPKPKRGWRWSGFHQALQYAIDPKLYARAPDGSIRLRQPKAPSRADNRRARGHMQRLCKLCKLGRITRADRDARALALPFARGPLEFFA